MAGTGVDLTLRLTLREGSVYYFAERSLTSPEPHYFIVVNSDPLAQRVLVLSAYSSAAFVSELLQIGALGYVLKASSSEFLIEAILAVANGHRYLCPAITAVLDTAEAKAGRARSGTRVSRALGAREKQVLRLLASGKSSPQIADDLKIAPSTVDVHRRNIMGKLGLHSVAELTHYAMRTGLIGI